MGSLPAPLYRVVPGEGRPSFGELNICCSSFWFAVLVREVLAVGFCKICHRGFICLFVCLCLVCFVFWIVTSGACLTRCISISVPLLTELNVLPQYLL